MVVLAPLIAALPQDMRALGVHISLEAAQGRRQNSHEHETTREEIKGLREQVEALVAQARNGGQQKSQRPCTATSRSSDQYWQFPQGQHDGS